MGMLLKASTKKSRMFESRQAFLALAVYLPNRDFLADPGGFVCLHPVVLELESHNQRNWGLSPMELWAYINRFTCWLSQLPLLDRSNFKLTAPNVRGLPANFYRLIAPEPAVMGSNA